MISFSLNKPESVLVNSLSIFWSIIGFNATFLYGALDPTVFLTSYNILGNSLGFNSLNEYSLIEPLLYTLIT